MFTMCVKRFALVGVYSVTMTHHRGRAVYPAVRHTSHTSHIDWLDPCADIHAFCQSWPCWHCNVSIMSEIEWFASYRVCTTVTSMPFSSSFHIQCWKGDILSAGNAQVGFFMRSDRSQAVKFFFKF